MFELLKVNREVFRDVIDCALLRLRDKVPRVRAASAKLLGIIASKYPSDICVGNIIASLSHTLSCDQSRLLML